VSFGPVGATPLGDGRRAERELFEWWSEMIEVPVVAEGALDEDLVRSLAPVADFFAFGPELWGAEDPAARLRSLVAAHGPPPRERSSPPPPPHGRATCGRGPRPGSADAT
jgi:thiamine-phosphate pyrophosphorylase